MAEPEVRPGDPGRPPPQSGGGNGGDDAGPIDWQARAVEAEKKLGTVLNENKSLKKRTEAAAALTEKIKGWNKLEEAGHTPEQIEEILGRQEAQNFEQARDKGEIDKLLDDQRKKYEQKIKAAEEKAQKVFQINQKLFVDDVLNRALDKVGIEPRLKRGAFGLYRTRFTVIEDPDSDYGMRTVVKVGDDYMEPDEFMRNEAENNEDFAPYLKQSMAGGGGAGGGAGARVRFKARSDMTAKEKSDYISQFGKAAYDQLPWKK
jgi:hypothetical protein